MALILTIQAAAGTIQSGSKSIGPFTVTGTGLFDRIDAVTLASGDNTITVPTAPTGVIGCVITPPAGNTNALTLKGAGGDTGLRIPKAGSYVHIFDSTAVPVSLIINSGAAMTAGTVLTITWF